jgi:hypothetical protein
MRINVPNRRISPAAALGILLVALAVFGWGLQYKVSLYQSPVASANASPHANLLSQKERLTPSRASDIGGFEPSSACASFDPPAMLLIALILAFLSMEFQIRSTMVATIACGRKMAASSFFSFRPPPALK